MTSWQTSLFSCWFLPDASRGACFIFLFNELVTTFGFSHASQHIKTCLRVLENVPVVPDPLEKYSFGQLQEVGPRISFEAPHLEEETCQNGPPEGVGRESMVNLIL